MDRSEQAVDALLLCGDKGSSRPVMGESKAFLFLHGKPLFIHTLDALEDVGRIRRVFIVGDKRKLDRLLSEYNRRGYRKPVVTLEQWNNLLSNAWNGFLATLDGYKPGDEDRDPQIRNRVIFILPGDSPIVSPEEIDDFFDKADMKSFDYVAGMTPREVMSRYYPSGGNPGIKMAYIYLKEGAFRINNLHMARPFACGNRMAIQQMYNSRYQKDIRNIIRLTMNMWTHHVKMQSLMLYIIMQLSMFFSFVGLERVGDMTRRHTSIKSVTESIGRILGLRFGCAITTRGGAALDIDNEKDYETMKQMFTTWRKAQKSE